MRICVIKKNSNLYLNQIAVFNLHKSLNAYKNQIRDRVNQFKNTYFIRVSRS